MRMRVAVSVEAATTGHGGEVGSFPTYPQASKRRADASRVAMNTLVVVGCT